MLTVLEPAIPSRPTLGPTCGASPSGYRICVASHVSNEWRAAAGIVSLSLGYSAAGLPITTLDVEVYSQGELMRILGDLHAAQLAILRTDQICAA